MNYDTEIDEDSGFCPHCRSSDTVTITSKAKRVCLKCEFFEEFETSHHAMLAWRAKINVPTNAIEEPESFGTHQKLEPAKTENMIETVESRLMRIIIPTKHRDSFNEFLKERQVEQARPYKTDVWNNIESAYTSFEVILSRSTANQLLEMWVLEISGRDDSLRNVSSLHGNE